MSLDNLAAWIAWVGSSGGRGWLLAGVVIAVILAAACVAWVASKATRLPARQRPARTVDRADDERDIHPRTRLERILREDAASRPLTRAQIRDQFGVDVHDAFPEEEG
ncbi:hypothetical protein FH608_046470 [Nonomuraea phyllanthi]|uniref:Uncharacterized protein n=1 Tax=Nonomuraea phyllanthi TaxID=2219224 RepID=A0A5C4V8W3_9ACTN|nr:hypothetical protein [Nonomuraea phyllanthi]KAB8186938.1 hypothetical protein FH608_046470 [Nonomuraea phyllanthi]